MTDEELIDAYHVAFRGYEHAKSDDGNRVQAFVQFASAQMAMISRFGSNDYIRHYGRRYEVDAATAVASGVVLDHAVASCLSTQAG